MGAKALPGAGVKPRGCPGTPSTLPENRRRRTLDSCLEQRARRRSREQPRVGAQDTETGADGRPPPCYKQGTPFGLKGDVSSPIHYGDEATTIYPCGHSVVLYNSEAKDQELIPGLPQTKGITALALAPSRKWLCVAERGLETAQIGVYDVVHRRRSASCNTKTYRQIRSSTWRSVMMKYLLTQGVMRNGP